MLSRYIEEVRFVPPSADGQPRDVSLAPDGRAHLVFRLRHDGADLSFRGPLTRVHAKRAPSLPACAHVTFKAGGAYPFFGVPVDALTGRLVMLEDLWGDAARALLDACCALARRGLDPAPAMLAALERRMRHAPYEHASARVARAAMDPLAEGAPVAHIARSLGVSERHLRRAFASTVGYSPKAFARVSRFQRALALLRGGARDVGEVAVAAGYYDQAHLHLEFRGFAAPSPRAVQRGEGAARPGHH